MGYNMIEEDNSLEEMNKENSKTNFNADDHVKTNKSNKKIMSKSLKAGIQFPVGRVSRNLRKGRYGDRIGVGASVYLASVLEYLAVEVVELAGHAARDDKKSRIGPRHIKLAVHTD